MRWMNDSQDMCIWISLIISYKTYRALIYHVVLEREECVRGRCNNRIKLKRLLAWHFRNIRDGRIVQEYES